MVFNEHVNPVTNSKKLSRKIEICNGVKIREEKFGSVIFDTLREKVFIANETGKDIVHLLEKGQPTDKIVDILADSYVIPQVDIKDDVISFISQLKDNGIIKT